MRLILAAIVTVALPVVAAAQSAPARQAPAPVPGAHFFHRPAPPPSSPPSSIGLPLPPIGLPLPRLGLPPLPGGQLSFFNKPAGQLSFFDSGSTGQRQHSRGGPRRKHSGSSVIYVVPPFGYDYWGGYDASSSVSATPSAPAPPVAPESFTGIVQLDVQPSAGAQVYADGYYVGMLDDLYGGVELDEGPHRIDIRANGFETASFQARVTAGRAITYRGTLKRIETKPAADATPRAEPKPAAAAPRTPAPERSTFYFIPGCYAGNVAPRDVVLPAGCDISQVITSKP